MRLEFGISVRCTDGKYGELADLIIDPATKHVTHLVVKPREPAGPTRMIPVDLVRPGAEDELSLRCSKEQANKLDTPQDFAYFPEGGVPVSDPKWDVGVEDVVAPPLGPDGDMGGYAFEEP